MDEDAFAGSVAFIKCHKCGATPNDPPYRLDRVNETGVTGIWECRPTCGAQQTQEDALIGAINGTPPPGPRDCGEGEKG